MKKIIHTFEIVIVSITLFILCIPEIILAQNQPLLRLNQHFGTVTISPDGNSIFAVVKEKSIDYSDIINYYFYGIDADTGTIIKNYGIGESDYKTPKDENEINIMPAPESTEAYYVSRQKGIAISPNGNYILANSGVFQAKLWDAKTGQEIATIFSPSHYMDLPSVQRYGGFFVKGFSPDSQKFFTVDTRGILQIWDTHTQKELYRYDELIRDDEIYPRTFHGYEQHCYFLSDNKTLFASGDYFHALIDSETGKVIRDFEGLKGILMPDEKTFLSYYTGEKRIYYSHETNYEIPSTPDPVFNALRFQDAKTLDIIREDISLGDTIKLGHGEIMISPDGNFALLGGARIADNKYTGSQEKEEIFNQPARLVSLDPFKVIQEFPLVLELTPEFRGQSGDWRNETTGLVFFPDGKRILIADNVCLQIWDISKYINKK